MLDIIEFRQELWQPLKLPWFN